MCSLFSNNRNFWVNTKDLQAFTLGKPTWENIVYSYVLSLDNQPYLTSQRMRGWGAIDSLFVIQVLKGRRSKLNSVLMNSHSSSKRYPSSKVIFLEWQACQFLYCSVIVSMMIVEEGLGFLNLTLGLRRWDMTSFCMQ